MSRKFPGRRLAKDNDGAYYSFLALRNGWEYRIAIARVDPYHLDAVPPAAAFNTGFPRLAAKCGGRRCAFHRQTYPFMTPPKFDGMSRLLPGVYVDRYHMNMRLDMSELLRANGRDDTPENRAELRETARQLADIMGARLQDE